MFSDGQAVRQPLFLSFPKEGQDYIARPIENTRLSRNAAQSTTGFVAMTTGAPAMGTETSRAMDHEEASLES